LTANAQSHHAQFSRVAGRLAPQLLRSRTARSRDLVTALSDRVTRAQAVLRLRRRERLDAIAARLTAGVRANADAHRARLVGQTERVRALGVRAQRAIESVLDQCDQTTERYGQLLRALSYRGVLARGFALVRALDGRPLRTAASIAAGERMDIEFSDGRVRAHAEGSTPDPAPPPAPPRRRRRRTFSDPGQGSLF
jgi:exodeoxyribonuclease VII large subunit